MLITSACTGDLRCSLRSSLARNAGAVIPLCEPEPHRRRKSVEQITSKNFSMTVSVELPDTIVGVDARYLKEALIAALYSNGKLSEKQSRKVLGMSRRAFQEMLPRYGFSILVDTAENLDIELNA